MKTNTKVEIVKQVKLTTKQRLTLISMANNNGVVRTLGWDMQADLKFLGLVEECNLNDPARLDKEVSAAWKALAAAVKKRDVNLAEKSADTISHARYERDRKGWRLTAAASEYLSKGQVTVTVGKGIPGAQRLK